MGDTKDKAKKPSKIKGLQSEFKKIVWPDKMTLAKQTAAVVSVSLILGALISVIDALVKFGIDILVR